MASTLPLPIPRILAAAALLAAVPLGAAQAQGGDVVETHEDWQIRCYLPGEGRGDERCAMFQFVVAEDREDADLRVLVWRDDADGPILQVYTPLAVRLRSQVTVTVDEELLGRMEFERCDEAGCIAEVLLDEAAVERLRNGEIVFFGYQLYTDPDDQAGIGFPIALAGFGDAFDILDNMPPAGG